MNIKDYFNQISTFFINYYNNYKQSNENSNLSVDDEWFKKIENCKKYCVIDDNEIVNN